ncbi:MAG: hypothetical protein ACR2O6_01570 [Ilumatobacteraceae bacterium]
MITPRAVAPLLVAALLLAGCMTGERPSFDPDAPPISATGDPNIDAVLERLDRVRVARFTAEYDVTRRFGEFDSEAVVVQADNGRRSITINDVRFLIGDGTDSTCNLSTAECGASINDAEVSDSGVTHEFYAASFATRLRVDANRRVGDTTGYTRDQAGQAATCVDIPLSGVTKSYCAVDAGPLAHYNGNDLLIDLTAITDVPDETKFESS